MTESRQVHGAGKEIIVYFPLLKFSPQIGLCLANLVLDPSSHLGIKTMNRLHAFLFGSIESIDIHSDSSDGQELRTKALASIGIFDAPVPVRMQPALLGADYVLVQYKAGLLREAHADVLVLN